MIGIGMDRNVYQSTRMNITYLIVFLTVPLYLLDQATKFWTVMNFPDPPPGYFSSEKVIPLIENTFHWVRVHNQGVAFGLGNGSAWAPIVFLFVPFIALVMLRIFWKKGVFAHPLSKLAIALLLAGILGNLTDRLVQGFLLNAYKSADFLERLSQGYVVDFVAIRIPWYAKIAPTQEGWWPAFNVADSCICIAAILLFVGSVRDEQLTKKSAGEPAI